MIELKAYDGVSNKTYQIVIDMKKNPHDTFTRVNRFVASFRNLDYIPLRMFEKFANINGIIYEIKEIEDN